MRALVFALILLAPATLLAQGLPSSDPRVRAAERYQTKTWSPAGPAVTGWSPDVFKVAGWDRLRVKIDARQAEAHVDLARRTEAKAETKNPRPQARLRIRRHATSKAARDATLAHLAACTVTLEREEGFGEVAFSIRARGELVYLVGVRGDLSYTLRANGPGGVEAVAAALDAQLRLASKAPKATGAAAETTTKNELKK
ncbi:MAG: hypothetical protein JKY65_08450, partial [Planctomycetes bacterium]|nr:hypothetical protein [Planctomycetota bacterium]